MPERIVEVRARPVDRPALRTRKWKGFKMSAQANKLLRLLWLQVGLKTGLIRPTRVTAPGWPVPGQHEKAKDAAKQLPQEETREPSLRKR